MFIFTLRKAGAGGVHKSVKGLVKAMLLYGDPKKRLVRYTDRDRWYSSKNMDGHRIDE